MLSRLFPPHVGEAVLNPLGTPEKVEHTQVLHSCFHGEHLVYGRGLVLSRLQGGQKMITSLCVCVMSV